MVNSVDIDANLRKSLEGRGPNERDASFDYCFNYFQAIRDSGQLSKIADPANIEVSCLHLGFYLASWGMFRGSAELLQKSARHLVPVVEAVARTDPSFWKIDADVYTDANIKALHEEAGKIRDALPGMTDILLTKIMLGVFGSVPAFDENFKAACKSEGIVQTFGIEALSKIGAFYKKNAAAINSHQVTTVDFISGVATKRMYTRAKLIDMAFFIEGEKQLKLKPPPGQKKLLKQAAVLTGSNPL